MRKPRTLLAILGAATMCLIWGTTWAAIQIGLKGIPPFSGVAIRFAIASPLLLAAALAMGVKLGRSPHEKTLWVVNGLLQFTISYGVVYWAEQWVPSGLAAVLFATYPLFVAMLAHVALPGESLRPLEVAGVVIGFGGIAVIFSEDFQALGGSQVAVASAVMLISPFVSAVTTVAVKRWGSKVHPLSITAIPMAICAGVMGVVAFKYERGLPFTWDAVSVGALLYLAIFGSAVTFTLYFWLLRHYPAKRLSLIAYIIPIIAVGVGVLRNEPLTVRELIGAAVVIAGVALAVHKHGSAKTGPEAEELPSPQVESTSR
jgi:drug/metabolite transporter (DMT)-like permease